MSRRSGYQQLRVTAERVLEFMRLLWAIDHELQMASKRMRQTLGVTGPQRLAIRVIDRLPDGSAQAVAGALHLHKSTVTGILQRLEKQGLVKRQMDPNDGRRVRLRLTGKGQRISAERSQTIEAAVQLALSRVTHEKLDAAREVLSGVAEALEESRKQFENRNGVVPRHFRRSRA
jgi:DNA-binding MarR family transcriptional regulator